MKGEVWDLMRRQSEVWLQSMIGIMMQFEASGTRMQGLPTARSWDPMQSGMRASTPAVAGIRSAAGAVCMHACL